jgi:phospholipid-binding lipoprotein MlaA
VGVLGLFDIATPIGLAKNTEDLGQTFGWWGIEPGPYLVLPFLGPRNTRDAFGMVGDWYTTDPITYMEPESTRWTVRGVNFVDLRAQYLGASDILEQAAGADAYIFTREAYRQRRRNQVYDGNPPPEPFPFEEFPE